MSFGTFCKNSFTNSDLWVIWITFWEETLPIQSQWDSIWMVCHIIVLALKKIQYGRMELKLPNRMKTSSSKDDNDPSSSPPTWTNVTLTQRIFLIGLRMMCFDRFWWMWSIIMVCYWTCAFVIVHNYFLCNLTTILWIWVFDIHLGSKV